MAEVFESPLTIRKMLVATWALLNTLTPEQRAMCEYPMDHPGRVDWDFIPKPDRTGIPLTQLDMHQRTLAHNLLATGLSDDGYSKALSIMAMENVLRQRETSIMGLATGSFRHDSLYYLSFFGRPAFEDTWTWRFLGHHLSLSYTIVDQRWLSVTPCNMGAQPASSGALAPLREDEDLAFDLLGGLDGERRGRTVIHDVAPADYATRQVARIGKVEVPDKIDLGIPWYEISETDQDALKFEKDRPKGIPGSDLSNREADLLVDLVECYFSRMPEEVADAHLARVKADGLENLWFAWAGGPEKGTSHYYRIQGSEILIEFDNAIDNGNHIHSVWRDYRNDLGHDLLIAHYEHVAHHGHHLKDRLESTEPADDQPDDPAAHHHDHASPHDHGGGS